MAKLPSDIPKNLSEADEVLYRIGEFVETFSNMELMLALVMGALTGMSASSVQFIWEEAFIDAKIKAVRRAAIERLGTDDLRCQELRKMLNAIVEGPVRFRNRLLHGSYSRSGYKMKHGRLGKSFEDLHEGLEELSPSTVYEKSSELYDITLDLASLVGAIELYK
jgi:hypothetical protein